MRLTFKNGFEPVFDCMMSAAVAGLACWMAQKGIPQDKKKSNDTLTPRNVAIIVGIENIFRSVVTSAFTGFTEHQEISPARIYINVPFIALIVSLPLSMRIAELCGSNYVLNVPNYISLMGYLYISRYINLMTKGLTFATFPNLLDTAKITLEKQ